MSLEGFSASQIAHIAATTLDDFIRGPLFQLGVEKKPLLKKFEANPKSYNGAKEVISMGVKMERGASGVNDGITGYSGTEQVHFYSPGNGLRASYVWREHHIGYTLDETQLKTQGILVGDEFGKNTSSSGNRFVVLANILDEANADFAEQYAKTMNLLMWGDGTSDAMALHGLRTFIRDVPTLGVVGGLSSVTHTQWRNRARTAAFAADGSFTSAWGGNKVTSAVANGGALLQVLQYEMRQLMRYGGNPNTAMAGSSFLDAMETEIRANGQYYQDTSSLKKSQDGAIGGCRFKGIDFEYDPTLDLLGRAKYAYVWDDSDIMLRPLEGDWKRIRNPARPHDQFVLHKSMVCTGQICARRRDSSLVCEIA